VLCRIESRRENGRLILHVAGHLVEANVSDLLQLCGQEAEPPIVELDELISADAIGMDALMQLRERGAQLRSLPEYLRLKLANHAREPKS
jgi:UDP-N-acetyl-D-mannosaminuronic acid transferase (WecB/TagA/CpsF family)